MMHHVFGWITLWLAIWLAYQSSICPTWTGSGRLDPFADGRRCVLDDFSDLNLASLSNELPVTDPERCRRGAGDHYDFL